MSYHYFFQCTCWAWKVFLMSLSVLSDVWGHTILVRKKEQKHSWETYSHFYLVFPSLRPIESLLQQTKQNNKISITECDNICGKSTYETQCHVFTQPTEILRNLHQFSNSGLGFQTDRGENVYSYSIHIDNQSILLFLLS